MKVLLSLLVVLFIALQVRLWFGDGSIQEVWRLRSEIDTSRAEVMRLTMRNQALEAEVADLKSGLEAIEERARADLGMVGEGEAFFQFVLENTADRNPEHLQGRVQGRLQGPVQPAAGDGLPEGSPRASDTRGLTPEADKQ